VTTRPQPDTSSPLRSPTPPICPTCPARPAKPLSCTPSTPDTPPLTDQDATARVRAELPEGHLGALRLPCPRRPRDPSNNGLCLHDDTLPLPDIIRLHLADAELAYLSACSTAHGGTRLTDEALHLASAFQMAGYWHVIATLWPLSDHAAATAAAAFYDYLPHTCRRSHRHCVAPHHQ
jgi:hypothetical protein